MSFSLQSSACVCLLNVGIKVYGFSTFPTTKWSRICQLLYGKWSQGGDRVFVFLSSISTTKWQRTISLKHLCRFMRNWLKSKLKNLNFKHFLGIIFLQNMREHWESVLANKNWIKSEMDPKVCVAAVCLVSKLVARFILLWWMNGIERKTHMYVHPQICVSTDIYSCCLYILYCMMLISCMYCIITQYVFSSVKASCSDLGLSATHIPS